MTHIFPSLIVEMISWLCFVKPSLLCKEVKKIQTYMLKEICKQYTKRIKGDYYEAIHYTYSIYNFFNNNMFKYTYGSIYSSRTAALCKMG
ncbi:hypothetical protein EKA14_02945 [Bacillus mycoides]|nr:hypothetical protein EKA14_02945 [Bacillus mycoides]